MQCNCKLFFDRVLENALTIQLFRLPNLLSRFIAPMCWIIAKRAPDSTRHDSTRLNSTGGHYEIDQLEMVTSTKLQLQQIPTLPIYPKRSNSTIYVCESVGVVTRLGSYAWGYSWSKDEQCESVFQHWFRFLFPVVDSSRCNPSYLHKCVIIINRCFNHRSKNWWSLLRSWAGTHTIVTVDDVTSSLSYRVFLNFKDSAW